MSHSRVVRWILLSRALLRSSWLLIGLLTFSLLDKAGAQATYTNQDGSVMIVRPPTPGEPSGGSQAPATFSPSTAMFGPEPSAPPLLGAGIEGINFDENGANNSGFVFIPPDPHGAAGSNHVVSIVNCSIEWHTKAGVQQASKRLGKVSGSAVGSFFASVGPTNSLFDPKVIYDQYSGRFVVVALERQDTSRGDPANTSRILLAVSATDDPNGTWYFSTYNSKIAIGADRWADYPGFAIDEEAVYLTMNMFSFGASGSFGGSRLWIINKQSIYTNGTPVFAIYNPSALASLPGDAFTMQPAHVFGASGVGGSAGTFLTSAGWVSGATDFLSVIRVDSPLSSPTFVNQFISLGDIHNGSAAFPDATQRGTNVLIDTGDDRALHSVWRNNNLYVINTVNPPSGTDAGQATAHWYRIATTNLSVLALAEHANIGGEDITNATHTYWASIAVDHRGNIGVGFAASSTNIYASAYYTGRKTNETAGTMQTPSVLAAGVDTYIRTFTTGAGRNRWGDYSGISVDPATDAIFWVFNEYAMTRGSPTTVMGVSEDGRWATRWGSFTFNTPPVPLNPGLGTRKDTPVTFSVVKLATDADGDTLSFTVSATSTNGGTVGLSGGNVTYTPAAGFSGTDAFTYTVDDGRGGTTNGTVIVTVSTGTAVSLNIVFGPTIISGNFVVRFAGIPGRTYTIEHSSSATGPWTKATNLTAPTTDAAGFGIGVFEFSESTGTSPSGFYRTVYPSY